MRRRAPTAADLLLGLAFVVAGACGSTPEEAAVDTLGEAVLVAREGDLDRAVLLFERAHEERPGFVDPLMFLANVHERRGDATAARDAYTRVLRIDPTLTAAGVALALTYLAEGRRAEARQWLEHALQADPGFEPTLFDLGVLSEQEGDRAQAAEWYRVAAVMDATSSRAVVRLAELHRAAGHTDLARELARHALERRPDDAAAAALLRTLDAP